MWALFINFAPRFDASSTPWLSNESKKASKAHAAASTINLYDESIPLLNSFHLLKQSLTNDVRRSGRNLSDVLVRLHDSFYTVIKCRRF
jgi:hypothetical protein